MYHLLIRTPFLIYLGVTLGIVVVLEVCYWLVKWRIARTGEAGVPAIFNSYVRYVPTVSLRGAYCVCSRNRFLPFAYAMVSAVIGTNSVILGKASYVCYMPLAHCDAIAHNCHNVQLQSQFGKSCSGWSRRTR
jgi:hypothetical protein